MQKLHFSIEIHAPKEQVWNAMLGKNSYPQWTEVFAAGSHFVGDWSKGSKMLFLADGETGEMGMVSRIKENKPFEYVSIEHLGGVENGEEQRTDESKAWSGAHENYTLEEYDGVTKVFIEMDTVDEHKAMFNDMWPKALLKLKALAEQ